MSLSSNSNSNSDCDSHIACLSICDKHASDIESDISDIESDISDIESDISDIESDKEESADDDCESDKEDCESDKEDCESDKEESDKEDDDDDCDFSDNEEDDANALASVETLRNENKIPPFEYTLALGDSTCKCGCEYFEECACKKKKCPKHNKPRNELISMYTSKKAYIKCIIFNISRYGKYTENIRFPKNVTECEAILAVEKYLSEPYDKKYLHGIRDNLSHENRSFAYMINYDYITKGSLLGGCIYLEILKKENHYHQDCVTLLCGS